LPYPDEPSIAVCVVCGGRAIATYIVGDLLMLKCQDCRSHFAALATGHVYGAPLRCGRGRVPGPGCACGGNAYYCLPEACSVCMAAACPLRACRKVIGGQRRSLAGMANRPRPAVKRAREPGGRSLQSGGQRWRTARNTQQPVRTVHPSGRLHPAPPGPPRNAQALPHRSGQRGHTRACAAGRVRNAHSHAHSQAVTSFSTASRARPAGAPAGPRPGP